MTTSEDLDESKSSKINMAEIEVERTELAFVTSINEPTRTFFAQLCKFSNEKLISMNLALETYCNKIKEQRNNGRLSEGMPKKVHRGDILCAQYPLDGAWYRAKVLSRDNKTRTCSVLYIDYGNVENVSYNDLVEITGSDLEVMEYSPFGITCFLEDSENFTDNQSNHLLDCLLQNYVMIKIQKRQTSLQWMIKIPVNAYNAAFWMIFKPQAVEDVEVEKKKTDSNPSGLCNEVSS